MRESIIIQGTLPSTENYIFGIESLRDIIWTLPLYSFVIFVRRYPEENELSYLNSVVRERQTDREGEGERGGGGTVQTYTHTKPSLYFYTI